MNYTALYRKLRPKNFNEVVGQEGIIKTLVNQILKDRITHAYLFCGTRGTGKTSTAKIFAKAVNCLDLRDGQPCNKCEMCMALNENRSLNVIEIDAASNNGVDNIREIREETKYSPTQGRFKVYIIDEVHMLSAGAFNALLKTLEEPPSHIIFILATTDPQKIPVTILSRCQRFDFKRISNTIMFDTIKKFTIEENIDIEDKAIEYIVRLSDGAMRDALSLLDRCISYFYEERITFENVLEISGSVDNSVFFELTDALIDFDSEKCIGVIDKIISNGRDINQFVSEFILHFRNLLIALAAGNESNAIDLSQEQINKLVEQSYRAGKERLIKLTESFSELQNRLKYSFNNRVLLEVHCIKLCSAVDENDFTDILEKISLLEKQLSERTVNLTEYAPAIQNSSRNNETITAVENLADNNEIENSLINDMAENAPKVSREIKVPREIKEIIDSWESVVECFSAFDYSVLKNVEPKSLENETLYIVCTNKNYLNRITALKDEIIVSIRKKFNKECLVSPVLEKDYELLKNEALGSSKTKDSENEEFKGINFPINILP